VIIKKGCDNWSITKITKANIDELMREAGMAATNETAVLISHDNRQFLKHELTSTKTMTLTDAFDSIFSIEDSESATADDAQKRYCRAYLDKVPGWIHTINLDKLDSLFEAGNDEKVVEETMKNVSRAAEKNHSPWSNYKPKNIGVWASSAGCETPLHFDLCHGFLCQVKGRKSFLLAPPEDTNSLAWKHASQNKNSLTSGVDLSLWMQGNQTQRNMYPHIDECAWRRADLDAGDILYTPPGWWHHVTSVTKSLSVLVPTDPGTIDELPWNVHACA